MRKDLTNLQETLVSSKITAKDLPEVSSYGRSSYFLSFLGTELDSPSHALHFFQYTMDQIAGPEAYCLVLLQRLLAAEAAVSSCRGLLDVNMASSPVEPVLLGLHKINFR